MGGGHSSASPAPSVVRCARAQPGELLHLDTKKLGRFCHAGKCITRDGLQRSPRAGRQHVPVAVDDHSRLAYAQVRSTDRRGDALTFLERALAWFRAQGISVQAVTPDIGSAYRSAAWRRQCMARGLRHLRTRPYTPRANGKAECFIQILLRQWAYAFADPTSAHRTRALRGWLRWYHRRRPHGSLGGLPPVSRVSPFGWSKVPVNGPRQTDHTSVFGDRRRAGATRALTLAQSPNGCRSQQVEPATARRGVRPAQPGRRSSCRRPFAANVRLRLLYAQIARPHLKRHFESRLCGRRRDLAANRRLTLLLLLGEADDDPFATRCLI